MRQRWNGFRSPLAEIIEQFIEYKRSLARRFDVEDKALRLFDRFLVDQGIRSADEVTPELIETFLVSRPRHRPRSFNHLLGVVRRLFDWQVRRGFLDKSPVRARPRRETERRVPFLFDRTQASSLLRLAACLPDNSRAARRGPTYKLCFALMYGLGLRVGEVARLRWSDVDFDRHLLVIRQTKFSKNRLVPFGPRMAQAIHNFNQVRRPHGEPPALKAPVFSFGGGRCVHPCTISQVFHQLVPRLQLSIPEGTSPPRIHDLRHSFAVGTLLHWYRQGIDPSSRLQHLATFLGHVDPASTAVYLTITAELLDEANVRFRRFADPLLPAVLP